MENKENSIKDIEETEFYNKIKSNDVSFVKDMFTKYDIKTKDDISTCKKNLSKIHKTVPSLSKMLRIYKFLVANNEIVQNEHIQKLLTTKVTRSHSGVVVITSFFSPYPKTKKGIQTFSCEYDCAYCPNNPGMPRSYDEKEPGVMRAIECKFDSKEQFWNRARSLQNMGHPLDKIELIFLGGTFSSFPKEYITEFFRDQFYAANNMNCLDLREPLSLQEEQYINQYESIIKIIGITIETRPDRITYSELKYLRELGVTRVQLGIQHIDDRILTHINRRCYNRHTIKAIKILKSCCFKVDIHIMPDLPHPDTISTEEMIDLDKNMFEELFVNPDLQADQWKIYPCATIPHTKIEEEYKSGKYRPYGELKNPDVLFELLIDVKSKVKPWVRLNRVVRDIPKQIIIGGYDNVSMRNDIHIEMKNRSLKCRCIRCREVQTKNIDIKEFEMKIRRYNASEGIEYFISLENEDEVLLGFIRLRIDENVDVLREVYFPELIDCSLIRELHVYGQVICHYQENTGNNGVQHLGIGKSLINEAIKITKTYNLNKIAVISGVGVKNYYIKQGFLPEGHYIVKDLDISEKYDIYDFKNDSSYDYVNEFSTSFCWYYISVLFSVCIYIFYNY